ncbi:hypothetical protein MBLNU457_g0410t1 [Dothideomycetes sp. NU457]
MAHASYGNRGRLEKRYAKKGPANAKRDRNGPPRGQEERPQQTRPREVEAVDETGTPEPEDDEEQQESDDEDDFTNTVAKPYSTLLESLKASHPEERQSKRRKIARDEDEPEKVARRRVDEEDEGVSQDVQPDEEDPEEEADDQDDDLEDADGMAEEDGQDDESDPYELHFTGIAGGGLAQRIGQITIRQTGREKSQVAGTNIFTSRPAGHDSRLRGRDDVSRRRPIKSTLDLRLKRRLIEPAQKRIPKFGAVEKQIALAIFHYDDLLYGGRTVENAAQLRDMASLHALNHVFKGRDKIIKNNERLAKTDESADLELRDQGFTRPKVLILLETRSACVKYVDSLMALCEPDQQENKKRFQDSFGGPEEDKFSSNMPDDYRELFEGNDDNDFRVGIKFTRKNVKFYSQFYASDMILASSLGLRRIMENDDPKKADSDFLSSIEVLIVDQADAMLMQNWEHAAFVLTKLNLQPKESHGCDFSRVRNFYLDNQASYVRQSIIFSSFITPELNRLYNTNLLNVAGKTKITPLYPGAILQTGNGIKQTFSRYVSSSPASDPDDRFAYFTSAIVPSILKTASVHGPDNPAGILIFIPSYFDYVRLRNYFAGSSTTENLAFSSISEYSSVSDTRRARSHFLSGRSAVLLYSGRAHHFHRYRVKGCKRVVWYGLPENERFYVEAVAGFLGGSVAEGKVEGGDVGSRALFSRWDGLKLERIVGSERVRGMLAEKGGDTFDFV